MYFKSIVKITRKVKPGPVVFQVTDGTKTLDAVIRNSDFDVNDVVYIEGPVSEHNGRNQIEIKKIEKSDASFDTILDDVSKPLAKKSTITSERYDKMWPMFMNMAGVIRRAIFDNRPIVIRHHCDTDGISSGLLLEQACKTLMLEIGADPKYNLYRSVSKAPFYEITDALKDVGQAKRIERFGQKRPLFILTDNGSTEEDILGVKTITAFGYGVAIIDHHNPGEIVDGKTGMCQYVEAHVNPYIVGLDSKTCAGMLVYEIGRLIADVQDDALLPAVSGISDRCDIPETDLYIAQTKKSREELIDIGIAMDFVSYNLRFDTGEGIYEEILHNKELVSVLMSEVRKGTALQLQSTLPYVRTQEINNVVLSDIDLEKYSMRFTYPRAGKVVEEIHQKIADAHARTPSITLGRTNDMLILRATEPVLPIASIIESLQTTFPEANIDGGGHECAGTIKFVEAHREAILNHVVEMLRKR